MRCVVVESEHDRTKKSDLLGKLFSLPKSLLGRDIDFEDLLLIGLIFLLLSQRKERNGLAENGKEKEKASSLFNLDGIKDIFGKLADNDLLIMMLIYMLL